VWGADAINTRVRPVLATQVAVPYMARTQLEFIDKVFGDPSKFLFSVAGAPYFAVGDADQQTNLTVDQILAHLSAAVDANAKVLDETAAIATYYGLENLAYEGGPDTFGPNNIAAKKAASLDPRMKDITARYMNDWFARGGALFNWFMSGPTNYDTQYGTWGLTDHIQNVNAPKILGIEEVRQAPRVTASIGAAVGGEVLAKNSVGAAPTADPYPRYLANGAVRDYVVRVPQAGDYQLRIRYAAVSAGGQLQILVNDRDVTTLNLPATGPGYDSEWAPNSFADSVPVTVRLEEGLNVVRLRVVNAGYTLYSLKFDGAPGTTPPPPVSPPPVSPPVTPPPPVSPPPVSPPPPGSGSTLANLVRNGSAVMAGARLCLTNNANQAGSAYTAQRVGVTAFDASFGFQLTPPNGNQWNLGRGVAFVLQNQAATALGSSDAGFGYGGVTPAVAVRFDVARAEITIAVGGQVVTGRGLWQTGLDLRSGHNFRADIGYANGTLSVKLTDVDTGASINFSEAVNLTQTLGATGFAGVAAGTGAQHGILDVTSWSFSGQGGPAPGNQPPAVTASGPASPVTGTAAALTATGTDDGGEPALTYTWTAISGPGSVSFSASGTNAAKSATATFTRAGSYVIRVTATDAGGLTATSNISVNVSQTLTSLSVTPATAAVAAGGAQAFAASGKDQFGQSITLSSVQWSVTGIGSVSSSGVYTAPATGGSATVTATTGGKTASAAVTVTPPTGGSSLTSLTRNGSAIMAGSRLRLTNSPNQAGSAFTAQRVGVTAFDASFGFQFTPPNGDKWALGRGVAFVLQNQGATAVGTPNGGFGYGGITPSVAVRFDVARAEITLAVGTQVITGLGLWGTGLDLRSGHNFQATIGYGNGTLTVTLKDADTGATVSFGEAISLAQRLGRTNAFAGVTAGTGANYGLIDVTSWNYTAR
jgi:hypothetical protein